MTQPRTRNRRFGDAVATLLDKVLFIRSTVPSTFPQLDLAAGHVDAYWQYECDLIGVAAGVLLARGDEPGALTAGARAVVAAQPLRVVWLGAFGTGPSADAAGVVTRTLLRMLGDELPDKVTADATILDAGGTVFQAGPMSNGPLSPTRRTVGLGEAQKRLFPARVSRATVAAAMLDEAEDPAYPGAVAIPLDR